jgi:hypothetical protein
VGKKKKKIQSFVSMGEILIFWGVVYRLGEISPEEYNEEEPLGERISKSLNKGKKKKEE